MHSIECCHFQWPPV